MTAITNTPPDRLVHYSWMPYVAVAGGAALLLKAALIIRSGDAMAAGPMAGLYLGGLLLALAAAVGAGLRQRRGRRTLATVGLVVLLLAYVMVLSDAVGPLFEVLSDHAWVADEGPVGLLGVVLLALGARARGTR